MDINLENPEPRCVKEKFMPQSFTIFARALTV